MSTFAARMRSTRALAVAGVLAVGLAGLAACSGDEPPSAEPAADRGTPGSTAPSEPLARYAGYRSVNHDDPGHWVCRPEAQDVCQGSLDTTVVKADGTLTPEPFEAADNPPVDCFYVYPTISRDQSATSDWSASPSEEGWVTVVQAARLRATCRVFAPVYRQMTLSALGSRLSGGAPPPPGEERVDPFADVLDAFRTYMAKDNGGRPFVLIGHSQGSNMLQRLVAEEIDPNADVREKLLTAFLAGWTLTVPEGADVGGRFKNVPLCRERGQTGCVFAWSSFRSTAPPPPGAYFGRGGPGQVAACTTPATLRDDAPADLHDYFPGDRNASILATLGAGGTGGPWVDPAKGAITTPFVSLPGLVSGACTTSGAFHYLAITVHGDPADPRADDITGDLTPEWGLHLDDINVVMGDIVRWVRDAADRVGSG